MAQLEMPANVEQTFGDENPGYFVFVEGGEPPKRLHPNRFSADREARRLAGILPGRTVHVMKPRSTYVNGLPLPETDKLPREDRMAAQRAKQIAAREGLYPGQPVMVGPTHYRFAGELGYIDHLGEGDDTTVYVKLVSQAGAIQRFTPSALIAALPSDALAQTQRKATAGPAERALRCGDIVAFMERGVERQGEIKQPVQVTKKGFDPVTGYVIRDIIDNIVMPRAYRADELKLVKPIEERPEAAAQPCEAKQEAAAPDDIGRAVAGFLGRLAVRTIAEKITRDGGINEMLKRFGIEPLPKAEPKPETAKADELAIGTEVIVIMRTLGPMAMGYRGKVIRLDDDDTFVWVVAVDGDGIPQTGDDAEERVEKSRLLRQDDPRSRRAFA